VAADDFVEPRAEVGSDRQVAAVVPLLAREAGPQAVDLAAADRATEHHHGVAVPMIGAARAVLVHRPPELRHRHDHDVLHAIAEIAGERGHPAGEVVEAIGEQPHGRALVRVVVPVAGFRERDLEADVGLDELRDLPEGLAER
jgi:hypothetical protein